MKEKYHMNYTGDFNSMFNKVINNKAYTKDFGGHIIGDSFFIKKKQYGYILNPNSFSLYGRVLDGETIEYRFRRNTLLSLLYIFITFSVIVMMLVFIHNMILGGETEQLTLLLLVIIISLGILLVIWIPQFIFAEREPKLFLLKSLQV